MTSSTSPLAVCPTAVREVRLPSCDELKPSVAPVGTPPATRAGPPPIALGVPGASPATPTLRDTRRPTVRSWASEGPEAPTAVSTTCPGPMGVPPPARTASTVPPVGAGALTWGSAPPSRAISAS